MTMKGNLMTNTKFHLCRNNFGKLVMTKSDGIIYENVFFVCAFPLTSPHENIAILNADGQEVAWIDCLSEMHEDVQKIVEQELDFAKFIPEIVSVRSVSSFDMPCIWHVETSHGDTYFTLLKEEDIRNIAAGAILILDDQGRSFIVRDIASLDKHSQKLIERFCIPHPVA